MESLCQSPRKPRTTKAVNLTGCHHPVGLSRWGSFRNHQRKSTGARIRAVLAANLAAASTATGANCQRPPLVAPDPCGVKAATNACTDDQCWGREVVHEAALRFEPFILRWEDSGSLRRRAGGFGGWNFPGSIFKFSRFLICNYQLNTAQALCCPYPLQTGG